MNKKKIMSNIFKYLLILVYIILYIFDPLKYNKHEHHDFIIILIIIFGTLYYFIPKYKEVINYIIIAFLFILCLLYFI